MVVAMKCDTSLRVSLVLSTGDYFFEGGRTLVKEGWQHDARGVCHAPLLEGIRTPATSLEFLYPLIGKGVAMCRSLPLCPDDSEGGLGLISDATTIAARP
jgi:hypothetical protein